MKENLQHCESGSLHKSCCTKGGERHGRYLEYYENGALKINAIFKNGTLSGVCNFYAENGYLQHRATFKEGQLNGRSLTYQNGEPIYLASYAYGKVEGEALVFSQKKLQSRFRYSQ